jgi:uncharacterized membrane protein (DUF106 family)
MLDAWNAVSLGLFDALLGWLLRLPSDVPLLTVGLGTGLLLTLFRRFTTRQDVLRRAHADGRRLKELLREAKARKDPETVKRIRATQALLGVLKLKAEGKPLLAVLLPLALLATWAFYRLEFHPPRADETVEIVAYAPPTAAGEVMHLAPVPGARAEDGWVRRVELVTNTPGTMERLIAKLSAREPQAPPPEGQARWRLRFEGADKPYPLAFRFKDVSFDREILVGQSTYLPAIVQKDGEAVITEVRLREIKLFGVVPAIPALFLPAWLVAYLLIAIPATSAWKRILKVY